MRDRPTDGRQPQQGELTDLEKAVRNEEWLGTQRHDSLLTSGIKGLAVLNSAGVAAMLGFLQALIAKPEAFASFRAFGIAALALFLAGAIGASVHFYPHVKFLSAQTDQERNRLKSYGDKLFTWAILCPVLGSLTVLYGIGFRL